MRLAFVSVLLAATVACSDDRLTLPLAAQAGDLTAIAYWKDGRPQIALRAFEAGQPFEVDADRDRPVYTYLLEPAMFVEPDGAPLTPQRLADVQLRRNQDPRRADECGRCLASTAEAPQPIFAGDACTVPRFAPAAAWQGDAPTCFGSVDGRLCAPGTERQREDLDEIRRQLVLVWPGDCACRPADAPSLGRVRMEAIGPLTDPWPVTAWARAPSGQLAGFHRDIAVRYDPGARRTLQTLTAGADVSVRTAVALDDGDYLVTGAAFNTSDQPFAFYRVTPTADGFAPWQRVGRNLAIRPNQMRYLEPGGPLYMFGTIMRSFLFESAVFVCDDELDCASAPVGPCPLTNLGTDIEEGRRLANGVGLARAARAVYFRPAGAGHQGAWTCRQPERFDWQDPARTDPVPPVDGYRSLGVSGSRAFICAHTQASGCTAPRAVVLTADVPADAGLVPNPEWKIAYVGPEEADCEAIVERGAEGVRVVLENLSAIDVGPDGRVRRESTLDAIYGPQPGRAALRDLGDDVTLHIGYGNATAVHTATGGLQLFYGTLGRSEAPYEAGVELADGRFAVFGPNDVQLVDGTGAATTVPLVGDAFRAVAAAVDLASPAAGPWRLVVGGDAGELATVALSDTEAAFATIPFEVDAVPVRGVAAVTAGRFVVAGPGTRLSRVDISSPTSPSVRPIPVDWDDPRTEQVEIEPTARDECTEAAIPADIFRDIAAARGIAWAVGYDGLVLRVLPGRADRFAIETTVNAEAVDVRCPDFPLVTGQSIERDLGGFDVINPRAYVLQPTVTDPRGRRLISIAESEIIAIRDFAIRSGRPVGVLRDGPWLTPTTSGFSFVLSNGFVHRVLSGVPPTYIRSPFEPYLVIQASDGTFLLGAEGGLLAIGSP